MGIKLKNNEKRLDGSMQNMNPRNCRLRKEDILPEQEVKRWFQEQSL